MQPLKFVILSMLLLLLCQCGSHQHAPGTASRLGSINFSASGKPEAQAPFEEGLLLLHSFEYDDAAEAFREARKTDPAFVMAYWGEAMTYNHTIWREQNLDKGRAVLQQLAATPAERMAKAKNELEKDLIQSVDILYGKGNKTERDSSYNFFLESLYQKYPGNDEVAAFYALSLINWGGASKNGLLLEKSVALSKAILLKNPRHPGALHYIIHAYDDPQHAALALATADKYALTAPDAGHALHMPTHTYLALGMWNKVVSSNIASWEAEKERKQRKHLDNNALGYHAYYWLMYGYLQQNNRQQARNIIDSMQAFCRELPGAPARTHLLFMKTTYLSETDDYPASITSINVPMKDLNILTRARQYFASGLYAFHQDDKPKLDDALLQLSGELLLEKSKVQENGIQLCGNINRNISTADDIKKAGIIESELKGLQAWLKNDTGLTEKWLKQASGEESNSSYAYGPPVITKPAPELYGDWLVKEGRNAEAVKQYELSLKAAPNKILSVKGKEAAQKRLKGEQMAFSPAVK
jgi:hypothetical protein